MHATAVAHPNIALVKYWGKRDSGQGAYNLPAAGSLSMTLGGLHTRTTVTFDEGLAADEVELDGVAVEGRAAARVSTFLDLVRDLAGLDHRAVVVSANDFPTAAGLASSASGFAALALAATAAAGLEPSGRELSILARRGSGSAARSVYGGFVEMHAGSRDDGADAFAEPLFDPGHWDLRCLVAVTAEGAKEVGSTAGMNHTEATSPYYPAWIDSVAPDIAAARDALASRDFAQLAQVAERSCLRMHASAIAADPGVLYFKGATVDLIHRVRAARATGTEVFFTIDAGPHLKAFCTAEHAPTVEAMLREAPGVLDVLATWPGEGAKLL